MSAAAAARQMRASNRFVPAASPLRMTSSLLCARRYELRSVIVVLIPLYISTLQIKTRVCLPPSPSFSTDRPTDRALTDETARAVRGHTPIRSTAFLGGRCGGAAAMGIWGDVVWGLSI